MGAPLQTWLRNARARSPQGRVWAFGPTRGDLGGPLPQGGGARWGKSLGEDGLTPGFKGRTGQGEGGQRGWSSGLTLVPAWSEQEASDGNMRRARRRERAEVAEGSPGRHLKPTRTATAAAAPQPNPRSGHPRLRRLEQPRTFQTLCTQRQSPGPAGETTIGPPAALTSPGPNSATST